MKLQSHIPYNNYIKIKKNKFEHFKQLDWVNKLYGNSDESDRLKSVFSKHTNFPYLTQSSFKIRCLGRITNLTPEMFNYWAHRLAKYGFISANFVWIDWFCVFVGLYCCCCLFYFMKFLFTKIQAKQSQLWEFPASPARSPAPALEQVSPT